MSYEIFSTSPIGTVKELVIAGSLMRFVKSSDHLWFVEYAVKNTALDSFVRFTVTLTEMEASCLYDSYNK